MLMRLITGEAGRLPDRPAKMPDGIETEANLLWQPGEQQHYPWLDQPLRELIGTMMASDYQHRPLLESTLENTSELVSLLRSCHSPLDIEKEESKEAVRAFVQRFFLDTQGD